MDSGALMVPVRFRDGSRVWRESATESPENARRIVGRASNGGRERERERERAGGAAIWRDDREWPSERVEWVRIVKGIGSYHEFMITDQEREKPFAGGQPTKRSSTVAISKSRERACHPAAF